MERGDRVELFCLLSLCIPKFTVWLRKTTLMIEGYFSVFPQMCLKRMAFVMAFSYLFIGFHQEKEDD